MSHQSRGGHRLLSLLYGGRRSVRLSSTPPLRPFSSSAFSSPPPSSRAVYQGNGKRPRQDGADARARVRESSVGATTASAKSVAAAAKPVQRVSVIKQIALGEAPPSPPADPSAIQAAKAAVARYEELRKDPSRQVDISPLLEAVRGFATLGRCEEALAGLERAIGYEPSLVPKRRAQWYTTVFKACIAARRIDVAADVLESMVRTNTRPSAADAQMWEEAVEVLVEAKRGLTLIRFLDHEELFLLKAKLQRDLTLTAFTSVARTGRKAWPKVVDMVVNLKEKGAPLGPVWYGGVIRLCGRAGMPEEGRRIMAAMPIAPDMLVHRRLVEAFGDAGDVQGAVGAFEEMKAKGLKPNGLAYQALMRVFVDANMAEEAVDLLRESSASEKLGWEEAAALRTACLQLCSQAGRQDLAEEVGELPEGPRVDATQAKAAEKPSEESFVLKKGEDQESMVSRLEKRAASGWRCSWKDARQVLDLVSRPELRLRVLRVLEQGGLSHMAEHYKSLYFDLSRTGTFYSEVLHMLKVMEQQGLPLKRKEYVAALAACSRARRLDEGERLLESMRRRAKVVPDVVVYNALLLGMAQTGQWEKALATMYLMASTGLQPDSVSFNTAMTACARAGELTACLKLLRNRGPTDPAPDLVGYTTCLIALAAADRGVEAAALLEQMEAKGMQTGQRMYSKVLHALASKPADVDPSPVALLQRMEERGYAADEACYSWASQWLATHKDWRGVLDMMEQMRAKGMPMSAAVCRHAISACSMAGRWQEVFDLVQSLPPNTAKLFHYRQLAVRALIKANRVKEAAIVLKALGESIHPMSLKSETEEAFWEALKYCRLAGHMSLVRSFALQPQDAAAAENGVEKYRRVAERFIKYQEQLLATGEVARTGEAGGDGRRFGHADEVFA